MQIIFKDLLKQKNLKVRRLYVELRDGRFYHNEVRTNITLYYDIWNTKTQSVNLKSTAPRDEITSLDNKVTALRSYLIEKYTQDKESGRITKSWLKDTISHTDRLDSPADDFNALYDSFLEERDISDVRKKRYEVVRRLMLRYEQYVRTTRLGYTDYRINISSFNKEDLEDLHEFVVNEYDIYDRYPQIYEAVPETRIPKKRGVNTLHSQFNCLKAFFRWAYENGRTPDNPFKEFDYENENYGTPYYLSLQELKTLWEHDFSESPMKEKQRDIFVFQCYVGARVSDMMKLTKDNISNNILTYIPAKTKKYRTSTVTVPLSSIAKKILEKYDSTPSGKILPFISEQNYNDNLKAIFKEAGIERKVPILNSLTGQEEYKPLYEVASSHLARRTFVGNLYKKVKDPNLIGSMSGHAPGSKSFLRYRNIDEDMQKELINALEI